jgi:hypothetical protein
LDTDTGTNGVCLARQKQRALVSWRQPFFADQAEIEDWLGRGGTPDSFIRPTIEVTRETLFSALNEVDRLADWIEARMDTS